MSEPVTNAPPPPDPKASREYPARPILAASAAVFRDGKVLLGSRRNPPAAGVFSLPGGLVETGETLQEAALRELMEETGVVAEILAFNGHAEVIQRDDDGRVKRHFVIVSFVARWVSGEGEPNEELGEVLWADEAKVASLTLTPGLLGLLSRARAFVDSSR
jgi:8-oxo-dGTP diphosphatase